MSKSASRRALRRGAVQENPIIASPDELHDGRSDAVPQARGVLGLLSSLYAVRLEANAGSRECIAKRAELPYQPGERTMVKVKHSRTADCVVGGYRAYKGAGGGVGSLLLGLYDEEGKLHHVGHTSGFTAKERRAILESRSMKTRMCVHGTVVSDAM